MDFFSEASTPAQRRCSEAIFERAAVISDDKAPAAAEAGGAETGADAVDGAGATAAEVAAAGAAAGTTSSVGADLGLPSKDGIMPET